MKTWRPWTITDGTLQLTEWPDHGPGVVVVEGDVFAAQEVAVVDLEGDVVCHTLPPGVGSHDTDPWDYDDVLRDLFAHIDANPQTHYTLRTLHPERVRECWPATADSINSHHNYHRPNVTLSLGPLATQADADRLVPEILECCGLVNGDLEAYCQPTERIDLTEIARDDGWMIDSLQGVYTREHPPGIDHPGGIEGHGGGPRFTRIRVDGDRDENVRFIEQQAIAAGVAFALNWESEGANG